MITPEWELGVRLALAVFLGAALGAEREQRLHAAGIRDHALVALGAALFTIAGSTGFAVGAADPTRVAAQVVSGIGFLGAGAIIRTGGSVRGLTTAATLWISGALGVALGAGLYLSAIISVILSLLILRLLLLAARRIRSGHRHIICVEYQRGHGTLGPLLRDLELITTIPVRIHIEDHETYRVVRLEVSTTDAVSIERIVATILRRPEVRNVTQET